MFLTFHEHEKLKILSSGAQGVRYLQDKMVKSFFNFESARGAKYREYGNFFLYYTYIRVSWRNSNSPGTKNKEN